MSRLPFELFLALRYLRPKRTFVSAITLISVIGVVLGVAVLIIVISVMTGFEREIQEKILGSTAHLRVFKPESTLTDYPALIRTISSNESVKGVAPYLLGQVLVKTQPEFGRPLVAAPWLRGLDPAFETNVSILHTSVVAGVFDVEGASVLVGTALAHSLRLRVGDRLAVYSPRHLEEMERTQGKTNEVAILPEEFVVRGVFDAGYHQLNANFMLTSLQSAQDLYALEGQIHGLMVMLQDPLAVERVGRQLQEGLGFEYGISSWMEENSQILDAVLVEKHVMFYLLFFIMIVAAFGIMNSLITFVVQKTREIGTLKAIGATRGQVLWLFLSQSLLVGSVGVTVGFGFGMLALSYRNEFLHVMRRWTGMELFPAEIYEFSELPARIVPWDIAIICGSALVICMLAGLVPAWIAGRLKPVEALRHE
jgi:lipoprotein-releasing system permease protein